MMTMLRRIVLVIRPIKPSLFCASPPDDDRAIERSSASSASVASFSNLASFCSFSSQLIVSFSLFAEDDEDEPGVESEHCRFSPERRSTTGDVVMDDHGIDTSTRSICEASTSNGTPKRARTSRWSFMFLSLRLPPQMSRERVSELTSSRYWPKIEANTPTMGLRRRDAILLLLYLFRIFFCLFSFKSLISVLYLCLSFQCFIFDILFLLVTQVRFFF